jgi:hypothetical protein
VYVYGGYATKHTAVGNFLSSMPRGSAAGAGLPAALKDEMLYLSTLDNSNDEDKEYGEIVCMLVKRSLSKPLA